MVVKSTIRMSAIFFFFFSFFFGGGGVEKASGQIGVEAITTRLTGFADVQIEVATDSVRKSDLEQLVDGEVPSPGFGRRDASATLRHRGSTRLSGLYPRDTGRK